MSHHYSGPNFAFPRGDARLDFTDLFAFPKPGDPSKSILIMDVHPSVGVTPPGLKLTRFGGHLYAWGEGPEEVFACRSICPPTHRSFVPRRSDWHARAASYLLRSPASWA